MRFPIEFKALGQTSDSMSFKHIDLTSEVEIPVGLHVGAFGHQRRHDTHTGIDLYCPDGTPVISMGDGEVIFVKPFTGQIIDLPWWEDTYSVCVLHEFGYVIYGEIYEPSLKQGDLVKEGDILSTVKRVLKTDKGRPRSMLHLELHTIEDVFWGEWKLGTDIPNGLLNPSDLLLRIAGKIQCGKCGTYYDDNEMVPRGENDLLSDKVCIHCEDEYRREVALDTAYLDYLIETCGEEETYEDWDDPRL